MVTVRVDRYIVAYVEVGTVSWSCPVPILPGKKKKKPEPVAHVVFATLIGLATSIAVAPEMSIVGAGPRAKPKTVGGGTRSEPAGKVSPPAGQAPTPAVQRNRDAWNVTFHPFGTPRQSLTSQRPSVGSTVWSVPVIVTLALLGRPPATVNAPLLYGRNDAPSSDRTALR